MYCHYCDKDFLNFEDFQLHILEKHPIIVEIGNEDSFSEESEHENTKGSVLSNVDNTNSGIDSFTFSPGIYFNENRTDTTTDTLSALSKKKDANELIVKKSTQKHFKKHVHRKKKKNVSNKAITRIQKSCLYQEDTAKHSECDETGQLKSSLKTYVKQESLIHKRKEKNALNKIVTRSQKSCLYQEDTAKHSESDETEQESLIDRKKEENAVNKIVTRSQKSCIYQEGTAKHSKGDETEQENFTHKKKQKKISNKIVTRSKKSCLYQEDTAKHSEGNEIEQESFIHRKKEENAMNKIVTRSQKSCIYQEGTAKHSEGNKTGQMKRSLKTNVQLENSECRNKKKKVSNKINTRSTKSCLSQEDYAKHSEGDETGQLKSSIKANVQEENPNSQLLLNDNYQSLSASNSTVPQSISNNNSILILNPCNQAAQPFFYVLYPIVASDASSKIEKKPDFNSEYILKWLDEFKVSCKDIKFPFPPSLFHTVKTVHKAIFDIYCKATNIKEETSAVMKVYEELDCMIKKHCNSIIDEISENQNS